MEEATQSETESNTDYSSSEIQGTKMSAPDLCQWEMPPVIEEVTVLSCPELCRASASASDFQEIMIPSSPKVMLLPPTLSISSEQHFGWLEWVGRLVIPKGWVPSSSQASASASDNQEIMIPSTPKVMLLPPTLSISSEQHVKNEVTPDWNIMIQDHGDGVLLPDCCRVPITLRHLKEELYTPKIVSIGPLHHGNERLRDMERHKQIFSERFTQRAGLSRDDLVRFVQLLLVSKVRASYPETIDLTDTPKLIDMILRDAGFIIELFVTFYLYGKQRGNKDAIPIQPWLANSILFDLLLLENQLPFFFIEELFNKAFPIQDLSCSLPSFLKLTFEYFGCFNKQQLNPNPDVKIKHFTDLLRLFYLQGNLPERQKIPEDGSHILRYSANALEEARVKLRDNPESKFFLDLKFSGHTLLIPQIEVNDNTELLFRNMIALEQCHYPCHAYITDYALLLDWLIDTNKDVDLLIHKKIVRNYLGDPNNVASLINGLSDNVVQSTFKSDFVNICRSLNGYCENPCNERKATLKLDYCRTPWQTAASLAAILLLFLAVVQTVFSILQVVN